MRKHKNTLLLIAVGSSSILSAVEADSVFDKNEDLFKINELSSGYMRSAQLTPKINEGKCGEGMCGASINEPDKTPEGKCGEGKCGSTPVQTLSEAVVTLNQDLSFNISSIKYIDPSNVEHFYKVSFIFSPQKNKLLFELNSVGEIPITSSQGTSDELKIGKKIYDRAFGRGCGACHDISSNPQLAELIQAGELDIERFANTLINGRNGMPKAMDAIMAVGPVKKAGYTEEQAINAVYNYLGSEDESDIVLLSQDDKNKAVILNSDFSFNIPIIRYADQSGIEHYYNVDFSFLPIDNKMLFEATNITEL